MSKIVRSTQEEPALSNSFEEILMEIENPAPISLFATDDEPVPPRPAKSHYVETVIVEPSSPTLLSIWKSPDRDEAILDLYHRRKEQGPLIEEIPGDPSSFLVTFLYLGDDDTRVVGLYGGPVLAETNLTRFARSHVWYLTKTAPDDGKFGYNFWEECFDTKKGEENIVQVIDLLDELNPHFTKQGSSMLALPQARKDADIEEPEIPAGNVFEESLYSNALGRSKRYDLYLPAREEPQGVVVFFDGESFAKGWPEQEMGPFVATPKILDRFIEAGLLPPLIALFVHAGATRNEDLLFNASFANFIADELLPTVAAQGPWAFSPERVVVAGASFGGLCATYVALQRPDAFGNVLSMSGSFWVDCKEVDYESPTFQEGGIQGAVLRGERLPIRFFLETGKFEIAKIVLTNRQLRDILMAKGYDVIYREYPGNHDFTHWGIAATDGLIALTKGW